MFWVHRRRPVHFPDAFSGPEGLPSRLYKAPNKGKTSNPSREFCFSAGFTEVRDKISAHLSLGADLWSLGATNLRYF